MHRADRDQVVEIGGATELPFVHVMEMQETLHLAPGEGAAM